jgi:hypothetical protein
MFSFLQAIGQDCWQSSDLMTVVGDNFPSAVVESHPALTTYALLLCLLYFMIFVENSFFSILISWRSLFNRIALEDTLANKNLIYAINNTALLCIPTLALVVYFLNVSPLNFVFILLALAAFTLVHLGLFLLVGWLKYCPEMMRTISICGRMHLIVFTTMALLLLMVVRVAHITSALPATIFLGAAMFLLFILRAARSRRIFAENNCSLLFWFLYLCTLEILPLVVLIRALTRI